MTENRLSLDRHLGCMLGLAAGDALGTTVEFMRPGSFPPVADMLGGGVFGLEAGQWTDDTSMALCLGESLLEVGFDPADQMERYTRWYRDGYWSSTGTCFDIGNTVRGAIQRYERTGEGFSGSDDPMQAGNGSIMRLAPVPMYYAGDPQLAGKQAGISSRTTHGAAEAVDACHVFGAMIAAALNGEAKTEILKLDAQTYGIDTEALSDSIRHVLQGSYLHKFPPGIKGSGYVVQSLEAALWAFAGSSSFKEGALLAVNLGDDADTTGAVYGQLAGAYYGRSGIPAAWLNRLALRAEIEELAARLYEAATSGR